MKTIQPTFSGGEFAPSLWSRVDLQKYATGLRTAKNVIVHPHGGGSNRPGMEFIAPAKYADKKCRLVPFEFSIDQTYSLELGEKYVRFYSEGVPVHIDTNFTEFNPAASYSPGQYVKISPFTTFGKFGDGTRILTFTPLSSETSSFQPQIGVNTSDSLVVTVTGLGPFVKLANATPAKNSAALIQAAVRAAHTAFAAWTVTENAAYAAARPTAIGGDGFVSCHDASFNGYPTGFFKVNLAITGNANNTCDHPSINAGTGNGLNWLNTSLLEVATPYLEADIPDIKYTQSADVLYIVHPNYSPRMLVRYAYDKWALETFDFENGPFMPSNVSATTLTAAAKTGTGIAVSASADTFNALHVGSLWRIRHDIEGQRVTAALASVTQTAGIQCGKTWRITTHGNWDGQIEVQKCVDGVNWLKVRGFSSSMNGGATGDFNAVTYGDLPEPCQVRVAMTVRGAGTCNVDLTTDAYTHTGIIKITAVTNKQAATADILTPLGSIAATDNWAEGSWSNYRGWPSADVFVQDRLGFAATYKEPLSMWLSNTGEYPNFGTSDPLVDSDAIGVNLPSRKMNGIRNLVAINNILALTSASEWSVGPGSDGAITPTSITTKCQGARGSSKVDPIVIGNRVLFFQPMGSILRDLGYTITSDGYDGDELTLWANHLFTGYTIVDMAYQQEPDSLVWCVRNDGVLLSLTYLKEQEVLAWTRHETDGQVESICSIPGDGYNEVWLVVKRGGKRFIERLARRMASTDVKDQFFMDSGVSYNLGAPATVFTGLDHLEGKTVVILADGFVINGKTVASGQVTLDTPASKVHVGLPYVSDFETLNVELNLNTGTTQGAMIKISEVIIRFLNSRGGLLGANFSDDPAKMDEVNNKRTTEAMDEPIGLKSEDIKKVLASSGYSVGGRICYRQKDPLPFTILAVIPNVQVGS